MALMLHSVGLPRPCQTAPTRQMHSRCRTQALPSEVLQVLAQVPIPSGAAPQTATSAIQTAQQAASLPPGGVDAPIWVVGAGAIAVTVALSVAFFGLGPGSKAAEEIQQRDAGKWRGGKKR